jgi:uncharacterized protein HemX
MKFLGRLLASRFAGPLMLLLAALSAAGGVFGYIQTQRLETARTLAESRQQTINGLQDRVRSDAQLIAQRDALIDRQNAGIQAIQSQRQEDRVVYLQGYARADERAARHDDRAEQIMALPNEQLDELASCRASKILLEQELTQ